VRITSRLKLIANCAIIALSILAPILLWSIVEFRSAKNDLLLAEALRANYFERVSFRDQYFLYREQRIRIQWDESKDAAYSLLQQAAQQFHRPAELQILTRLRTNLEDSAIIFHRIVDNTEALANAADQRDVYQELDKRLSSQLLLKSSISRDLLTVLQDGCARRIEQAYATLIVVTGLFSIILAFATILTSVQLVRLIRKRLELLHDGTKLIAEGNLDYRLQCEGKDEFSELAFAIDFMTDRLQSFTLQLGREINERKRLAQEREQYFRFFRLSTDPMCIAAPNGYFKQVNPTFMRLTGYDQSELLTKPFLDFIAAEHRQKTADEMKQQTMRFENHFVCKDGQVLLLSWSGYFDDSDGVTYATAHDITDIRQAQQNLQESEQLFRTLAEAMPQIVWMTEADGWSSYCNQRWQEYTGLTPEQSYGNGWNSAFHEDDQTRALQTWQQAVQSDNIYSIECRLRRYDGIYRWWLIRGVSLHDADGNILKWVGTCTDIDDIKQNEQKLHLAANVFTHAREGIMITDTSGVIIDVNDAFSLITGYDRQEVIGHNASILNSRHQDQKFYTTLWQNLLDKGHWNGEIWNRRKNGEVYAEMITISAIRDAQGITRQYVALFSDISALKKHELQLEHIAHFDTLTGLPNRVLLADRLHQAMALAERHGQTLSLVYLDLDGFKNINDSHGHKAGDQLLMAVANNMKLILREGDTLARIGGDEFVAVLPDLGDIEGCIPMITRLLGAAAQPVHIDRQMFQVSASLGVSFYPQAEQVDADQLLRQADQAMYQAKLAGKNRYSIFDTRQDNSIRDHHESLNRIGQALSDGEFVLYYQPKVNMRSGKIIGAEALIRWQHPDQGLLPPALFLPAIEGHRLGVEIGEWVIDAALSQIKCWQDQGLDIAISVNISAGQLQSRDFVQRLRSTLAKHPEVSPDRLELEVLETSALEDIGQVIRIMESCREIGVMFALDDFGTGYSSLTYLKRLPVVLLKIDQSFVRDMLNDPNDLAIVDGILGLATAFGCQVIAEGVETSEHGETLLRLGCDLAQGYGIARPMSAEQLPDWAAAWRTSPSWTELPLIDRADLPLLFASAKHRAWIIDLVNHLKGKNEPPPINHHQCPFGKWLDSDGQRCFSDRANFQAIGPQHRQVHQLAKQLLTLHNQGRTVEALARLPELYQLRDSLLELLK
jgi:diguanylate cyclase (GGDEF)-like protein/PAS domain S-box-containing protein